MHTNRGFTLIELMIVVMIIAMLAAIAFPAFQEQVRKVRRSDSKAALTRAAQLQERWFTQNGSYTNAVANLGGTTSPEGYYTMSVAIPGSAGCTVGTKFYCYSLKAAPTGAQSGDKCGDMLIGHTGAKTVSGGSLPAAECW